MYVVLGMATEAVSAKTDIADGRFTVAIVAINLAMGAVQREPSFRVVKVPCFPCARIVAAFALGAKAPFVLVILFMAFAAGRRRIMECR